MTKAFKTIIGKAALLAAFLISIQFPLSQLSNATAAPAPRKVVAQRPSKKNNDMDSNRKSTFENPNFAFPETVEKDAEAVLNSALDAKEGVKSLRAAMQVIVAKNMVSESAFNANVQLLDSAASLLPAPYSQLCELLEANLYNALYDNDSWTFRQRTLPLDSYPEDPESWSEDLFAQKTLQLVNEAMADPDAAKKMPIKEIASLLDNADDAEKAGLSVYDFMVYNALDLLGDFAPSNSALVIPFRKNGGQQPLTPSEKCNAKAAELLDGLLTWRENAGNDAPLAVAVVQKANRMEAEERLPFLKQQYGKLSGSPESARVLEEIFQTTDKSDFGTAEVKSLYGEIRRWLAKHPQSRYTKAIDYDLKQLQQKSMSITLPQVLLPSDKSKGTLTTTNMTAAYVLLYKVPESIVPMNSLNAKAFPGSSKLVKTILLETPGDIPFSGKREFELPSLEPGYYVAVPSATPSLSKNWRNSVNTWNLNVMNVTDIAIITSVNSRENGQQTVYVVDARTQKPIEGATVGVYHNDRSSKLINTGKTDASGAYTAPDGNYRIRASYGNSVMWKWADFNHYKSDPKTEPKANILTDLAIYKPGDTVQFSLVGWTSLNHTNTLLKEKVVDVIMRDANWNPVDTLTLSTDSQGRCNGKFTIPKSGLLGTFSLSAVFKDFPNQRTGNTSFQVSEYKAPGFLVVLDSDKETVFAAGDTIKFKGSVKTYSGMPLGNSAVSYTVNWQPIWRWWDSGPAQASYGGTTTTDEAGNFTIELPTANLKGTRFERGIFTISVSATSDSGETQSAPDFQFSLGDGFTVEPRIDSKILAESDTIRFDVPVYDLLNHPVVKTVEYTLTDLNTGKTVTKGSFESPTLKLASSLLPSSKYRFTFNVKGDTLKTDTEFVIYRKDDVKPPYAAVLWMPEKQIVCKSGQTEVQATVGSGFADSWILCEVTDENGYVDRRWIQADGCNVKVPVQAPKDNSRYWVTFNGMHSLEMETARMTLIPEAQTRKLEVSASTFRDRISSGDKENWKFSFTVDGKGQAYLPAMAVMSDKSLNAITPFNWNFFVGKGYWSNPVRISGIGNGDRTTNANFSVNIKYYGFDYPIPTWNTYGYSLAGGTHYSRKSRALYAAVPTGALMTTDSMVEESAVEMEAPVMMAAASNSVSIRGNQMEAKDADGAVTEEAADEAGGMAPGKKEELRPVEMPLAFFMPDLKSDADGVVKVDFEVPNFNTTWQFQIAGYTEDLLTAGLVKDAVASKKVMVQSNLPRYLRTGDRAWISAQLFNNSTEPLPLSGRIEVYDPLTGRVIAKSESEAMETDPSGNRTIAVEFNVPTTLSAVAVRAYAYGGDFSDGEQDIIDVLPSSTPVVESTQFYIGSGKTTFEQKLPKYGKDTNLTLKYCDNPVWECILALPSISTPDSKNIISLMRALYANSFALDVAQKYPAVKAGLEKALAAKAAGDTTVLRSNLEKDANLKTVALGNTPWVNNAAAETARMGELNTLLDESSAKAVIDRIMTDVKSLQNTDGGWSWCPGMKSSLFMTGQTLLHFGMMKHIGCLPEGTDVMIKKAIAYCDKEIYKDYAENKHQFSTTYMLNYLYVRSFFDAGNGPKGFTELKNKALKSINDDWAGFSVYDKATAATLLNRSKGYEKTSRTILESLRQLASKSEAKGWWYDNLQSGWTGWNKLITTAQALQAYAEVEPNAEAVDGLRQWLVLQKETEDWGANSYTVEVIQSILSCGTDWTVASEAPRIKLGDKEIEIAKGELLTGIQTITLDPKEASGKKLLVEKSSAGPAWGGVISQYVSPIKDVKTASCENLKIEKKVLVVNVGEDGETVSEGPVKVGDRVRVTLTLTCDKDMDYVALIDERSACLEPEEQLSGYEFKDGLGVYREVRDTKTSFFIGFLPKGVNVISYDCHADREGTYALGIASAQSQYSPLQAAHSAGAEITVGQAR